MTENLNLRAALIRDLTYRGKRDLHSVIVRRRLSGPRTTLLLLLWSAVLGGEATFAQQVGIAVGPNVQASKARSTLEHNEVLLAADPENAKNFVGCSMAFSPDQNKISTIAYVSFDGGNSWKYATSNERGIFSGDPACTFGANGLTYFTALERDERSIDRQVFYRSTDYGKTWSAPITLFGSAGVDRTYVIVDQSQGSYRGRIYVYGQVPPRAIDGGSAGMSIALWRSLDNGITFEGPLLRPYDKALAFHPANSVVLSDGTLVCLVSELDSKKRNDGFVGSQYRNADQQNGTLKAFVSSDGGESLSPAVKISELYYDWRQESTGIPSLAADRGSAEFKDRLYAAWGDGRYGRTQILLSYSTDKGKTWSTPRLVCDGQPTVGDGPDNFMPVVAVNTNGVVGVMWYDQRDNHNTSGYYVRFTASLDGGDTWLPSVRVSEAPKTFEPQGNWPIMGGVWRTGSSGPLLINLRGFHWPAGGHTAGMAADADGAFHPFWIDNRTGVSQVWTAPVTVKGSVARNGSPDLAKLDDISASAFLELTKCGHDKATNVVHCAARLKNTSKETLRTPLQLRVITLSSELGEPRILDADNGQSGTGAVWDFSGLVKKGLLAPDESSEVKQLRFQITNPRSIRQGDHFRTSFVTMDARVLGHVGKTTSPSPAKPTQGQRRRWSRPDRMGTRAGPGESAALLRGTAMGSS